MKTIIRNGRVLTGEFQFIKASLIIDDGRITEITQEDIIKEDCCEIDAKGTYVIPGLFDIHTHGNSGFDFCDGDAQGLEKMAGYFAENGVTSFLATTMSLPGNELESICNSIYKYYTEPMPKKARLEGIYLEGPFLNPAKKGAQNEEYIISPDIGLFNRLFAVSKGLIKVATVAPELDAGHQFINHAKQLCAVSIAHTNASYDEAKTAIKAGVRCGTHLYNAMPGFTHRDPGVVGALLDSDAYVELIADGIHIHPAIIRLTFRMAGDDRIIFISDSMRATGMENGTYDFAGLGVTVHGNKALLADGTIAGSVTNLMECVRFAVQCGIPLEKAIKAASYNPARLLHMDKKIGSLVEGKYANIVTLDKHLNIRNVWIKGELVR